MNGLQRWARGWVVAASVTLALGFAGCQRFHEIKEREPAQRVNDVPRPRVSETAPAAPAPAAIAPAPVVAAPAAPVAPAPTPAPAPAAPAAPDGHAK